MHLVCLDKVLFYVCIIGVPSLERDKTFIVFSSLACLNCTATKICERNIQKCCDNVSPLCFHSIKLNLPIILSTTDERPSVIELWHFSPSTSCHLQELWEPESPWRQWWLWQSGYWPPYSWRPSLPWWWCADTATATRTTCYTTSTQSQWISTKPLNLWDMSFFQLNSGSQNFYHNFLKQEKYPYCNFPQTWSGIFVIYIEQ